MKNFGKIYGFLILAFLGCPTLFVITWSVGITRAVTQPDFLPELPAKIAHALPETADLLLEAAAHPNVIEDKEARTWLRAAAEAPTTPGMLMEEIGLMAWLRQDLSQTLHEIYGVLNGRYHPDEIVLDLKPLRRALEHEAIDRYFLEVVNNLPPCTQSQEAEWVMIGRGKRHRGGLPACKPHPDGLLRVMDELEERDVDMPGRVVLFEFDEFQFLGLDLFCMALACSVALFVIPGFFLILGAFVAEPMSLRAFKWFGVPTIITSLAVLATAFLPKLILKLTSLILVWIGYHGYESSCWPSGLLHAIVDRLYSLTLEVIEPLFAPVISTALVVGLCGVACCVFSMMSESRSSS